ncbi:MAG: ATP-dependent DNA ligase [Pseudolysinimonas sp.]
MGTLFYGGDRTPIRIDDRILAHLRPIATAKLRRREGFLLSWTDSISIGDGQSSVWIHPACELHYKFDGSQPTQLDATLLERLNVESIRARGIELAEATLAHPVD